MPKMIRSRILVACALAFVWGCSSSDSNPETASVGGGGGATSTCPVPTQLMCGAACTDVTADEANCGACGTVCSPGQSCTNSVCGGCSAATPTQCGATCVNLQANAENCGACGTNCAAQGKVCSAGLCSVSCTPGLTNCLGACVSLAEDEANCGTCGTPCAVGSSCAAGRCVVGGVGGATGAGGAGAGGAGVGGRTGAGGAGLGGRTGTGGIGAGGLGVGGLGVGGLGVGGLGVGGLGVGGANVGGANVGGGDGLGGANVGGGDGLGGGTSVGGGDGLGGGDGVGGGSASDLNCVDPVYGNVTIPAAAVISDFSDGTINEIVQDGRGVDAEPWHAYAPDDTNDSFGEMETPGANNPKNAANAFAVDAATSGPCNKGGSLHVKAPGGASYASAGTMSEYWGTGFGIDFMARTAERKKQTYDASKYTGVGFWAKCTADAQFAFFKLVDATQDADTVGSGCTYGGETEDTSCNQYGIKNAAITKNWTYYKLFFDEALQDPNFSDFSEPLDTTKMAAFQIHVNRGTDRTTSQAVANPFECWIDDVHFMSEPAPVTPSETVTWTTSGNKIMRNGAEYKIKGLVRPSMEWDVSGFAVTREDIQRMKSWGANAIRLAVIDLKDGNTNFWMGTKSAIYRRNVKRVINWILQEKMDVIMDLHYVGGMPSSAHLDFWKNVAGDSFFKDGRIIFELYNEPVGDAQGIKTWMQSAVDAIRGAGNDNLILVGGTDYTYDISLYATSPITDTGPIAYVTHPYTFKTTSEQTAYLGPAGSIPVIATEFGDANVESMGHSISPTQCDASLYSGYIDKFNGAGMSWTSWAWIVDAWGCGFPQLIKDYSGEPNAIGTPVKAALGGH
jgi:hypothetical protein